MSACSTGKGYVAGTAPPLLVELVGARREQLDVLRADLESARNGRPPFVGRADDSAGEAFVGAPFGGLRPTRSRDWTPDTAGRRRAPVDRVLQITSG